jgi:hypothetical protein
MTSTSETGHGKNVAHMDELISSVLGYGKTYNPSKASIKAEALQSVSSNAKNSIGNVNSLYAAYSNAVAAREAAFTPLSKLVTRALNALKATDTTVQVDESARTFARKIQGKRATPKMTEAEKKAESEAGKEVVEISSSQMSYDSRLDNFDKFLKILSSVPQYAPNEEDLKVTTLTTLYNDLKSKNSAVVNAATLLSNARILRNEVLYKASTGLVDIAIDTKTYIKSVFGATSPQFKQVSKLEFIALN